MKKVPTIGKWAAALLLAAASARGAPSIAYESRNGGGVSCATNGTVKLGATLGQGGLVALGTGGAVRLQSGFWKLENACELYPVALSSLIGATGEVAVTFNAVRSNVYSVVAIATEQGGPGAGTHAWTNVIATLPGAGAPGSTTTVFVNVSAATNAARFYRVLCADP